LTALEHSFKFDLFSALGRLWLKCNKEKLQNFMFIVMKTTQNTILNFYFKYIFFKTRFILKLQENKIHKSEI